MKIVKQKVKKLLHRFEGIEKLQRQIQSLESEIENLLKENTALNSEKVLLEISNQSYADELNEMQNEQRKFSKAYFENRHELSILKDPKHFGQVVPTEAALAILYLLPDANYFMDNVRKKSDLKIKSMSFNTKVISGKVFVNDCRNDINEEGTHRIIFNIDPLDIRVEINCVRIRKSYSINGISTTADMYVWDLKNLLLLNGAGYDFLENALMEIANLKLQNAF